MTKHSEKPLSSLVQEKFKVAAYSPWHWEFSTVYDIYDRSDGTRVGYMWIYIIPSSIQVNFYDARREFIESVFPVLEKSRAPEDVLEYYGIDLLED